MSRTISKEAFVALGRALDSRILPIYNDRGTHAKFHEMIAELPTATLPERWLERLAEIHPNWTFAAPVFATGRFFAIAVSPPVASTPLPDSFFEAETVEYRVDGKRIYLYEHPPYPLSRIAEIREDLGVVTDGQYVLIPGPEAAVAAGLTTVLDLRRPFARCPESLWPWVSPVKWQAVSGKRDFLSRFLDHYLAPDLYGTVPQGHLHSQYKAAACKNGKEPLSYHLFEKALSAFGIHSHAPAGSMRIFRGIRYRYL